MGPRAKTDSIFLKNKTKKPRKQKTKPKPEI